MGIFMKTTIDISDALLSEAKMMAAAQGTTLRQLVEAGLRHALGERKKAAKPFRLRKAAFTGKGPAHGLTSGANKASWEQIRELAYEGRGGSAGP